MDDWGITSDNELLQAVWQYLFDRNVPVEILMGDSITVNRKNHSIILEIEEDDNNDLTYLSISSWRTTNGWKSQHGHKVTTVAGSCRIDLKHPDSLQDIFEYVMSKKRK